MELLYSVSVWMVVFDEDWLVFKENLNVSK